MRATTPKFIWRNACTGKEIGVQNALPAFLLLDELRQLIATAPQNDAVEVCAIGTAERVTLIFHAKLGATDEEAIADMKTDPDPSIARPIVSLPRP